ncbi:hypothetical protein MKY34_13320 [Sporosarcina sp. FSL K6-1522]|uniref:hypothetical protein n=1 Tax=Sporosarcina sp. FSL K6-1522 TaxID=2921554 RepID=UPI00315AB34A
MIRDILRIVGAACLLASGILYFTSNSEQVADTDVQQMQQKIDKLQNELTKAKEELAIAQTVSSAEESPAVEPAPIVKAVLTIASGAKSTSVAEDLQQASIIQDATAFNDFLISNQLEGKIQIGEHNVDSSMDFQAIATVITTAKE